MKDKKAKPEPRLTCSYCHKRDGTVRRQVDAYEHDLHGKRIVIPLHDACNTEKARDL